MTVQDANMTVYVTIQDAKLRQFAETLITVGGLSVGFKAAQDEDCAEVTTLREVMEKYLHHAMNRWSIQESGHPMVASLRNAHYVISVANAIEDYYASGEIPEAVLEEFVSRTPEQTEILRAIFKVTLNYPRHQDRYP